MYLYYVFSPILSKVCNNHLAFHYHVDTEPWHELCYLVEKIF